MSDAQKALDKLRAARDAKHAYLVACGDAIRDHLGGKPELVGELVELLLDCREYFDDRADADFRGVARPVGNAEMAMLTDVDALLSRIKEPSRG